MNIDEARRKLDTAFRDLTDSIESNRCSTRYRDQYLEALATWLDTRERNQSKPMQDRIP